MNKREAVVSVFCGHLQIAQRTDYFDEAMSGQIRVRRVKPQNEPEHVQFDVTATKSTKKRTMEQSYTLTLTPEQVDLLVNALTKCQPPAAERMAFADTDARDRAFYGLPPRARVA